MAVFLPGESPWTEEPELDTAEQLSMHTHHLWTSRTMGALFLFHWLFDIFIAFLKQTCFAIKSS